MKYIKHINESLSQQELDKFKNEVDSSIFSLCEYIEDIDVKYYKDYIIYRFWNRNTVDEYGNFTTMTEEQIMRILNGPNQKDEPKYGFRIHFTIDKKKKSSHILSLTGDEMDVFTKITSHANLIRKKLDNYFVILNISSASSWPATTFELLIIKD